MKNIRFRKLLIMGLLTAVFITGCSSSSTASSWPGAAAAEEVGFISYSAQVYAIDGNNGSIIWRYPEEPDSSTQFYAPPSVGDDLVVVGSYNNSLIALDRENGIVRWQFNAAKDRYISSQLITEEIVLAPNADNYLYALDLDGDLLWRFKAEGPNWTNPVTDGNYLYFASMDHHLYALNLGYKSNSLELDPDGSRTLVSSPVWSVDLGSAIVANPVLVDETLFVATISGEVFAINSSNGQIKWQFSNTGEIGSIWGNLVVSDGIVFFGDDDGNLYALQAADGNPVWTAPYDAGAPIIAGGINTSEGILFATVEGRVFLINAEKKLAPIIMLETPIYSTPISVNGNIILALASKDELARAIDLNGNVIWNFNPGK